VVGEDGVEGGPAVERETTDTVSGEETGKDDDIGDDTGGDIDDGDIGQRTGDAGDIETLAAGCDTTDLGVTGEGEAHAVGVSLASDGTDRETPSGDEVQAVTTGRGTSVGV
jgi:hypothetical protein